MARLREFLEKNPAAGYGIAVLLLVVAGYLVVSRILGAATAPAPAPSPAQQPAPAPAATPAPPSPPTQVTPPPTVSAGVVPPGPSGRADPFVPLVKPSAPVSQAPRPSGPPLPPPPFPVPGAPLPPPPLPGAPQPVPTPLPPSPSAGIAVTGIVSDSAAVVVVQIGSRTEILFEGESAGDLKVVKIDAARRLVTLERAGTRFDVPMGGG